MPVSATARAAMAHLSAEPRFAALIDRVGPPRLAVDRARSPYQALLRAIAHQQLHGRAAEAILGRLVAAAGGAMPEPAALLAMPEAGLRGCGFSAAKIAALRDLAAQAAAGVVPTRRACARLGDEELVARLTQIRGIGRWTVEMLLISSLGRPDILPVDDFGVREGYRRLAGAAAQLRPRVLAEIGAAWAPYRSFAAWYLWRATEVLAA
ncbi:MAG: DNA-3-methyladenine glycosylase family protein [Acetobacteraceae bacterium]